MPDLIIGGIIGFLIACILMVGWLSIRVNPHERG